jgi:cephalosporin hydroxylase
MPKQNVLWVLLIAATAAILGYALGARSTNESTGTIETTEATAAADHASAPDDTGAKVRVSVSGVEPRDNSWQIKRLSRVPAVRRFFDLWGMNLEGIWANTFLGVQTIQNPLDVWVTQEILSEVKPDFIVETGTFKGGSAALWATLLAQINPEGRIISIDIDDWVTDAKNLPIVQQKVDFLIGSSTDPAIVAEVAKRVEGGKVVVILDSLHTKDHVFDELNAYAPLVGVGSYMIVQDTGMVDPAPKLLEMGNQGVDAFLASHDEFEVDSERERFVLTNNPRGYLKRVR